MKAIVIGSGFSSLSAACFLAHKGYEVEVLEKNESPGGRARSFTHSGFTFDMGPSWYWMPDVFENFFKHFGKKPSDYYQLLRLDPSYKVIFSENDIEDIPANMEELEALFEKEEKGSAKKLRAFLSQAEYKYQVGINDLVHKPSLNLTEFIDTRIMTGVFKMDLFQSFHKHARKFFKSEKLLKLVEFPVLFLGAMPESTPALYSLMNYADMSLGTWYPMGGMHKIVEGMVQLAESLGVKFHYNAEVISFNYSGNKVSSVSTKGGDYKSDILVSGADYNHTEQKILDKKYRVYSDSYWQKRTMAPSCLLYYVGVNKKLDHLEHHNLFFDEDLRDHAVEIYKKPEWPKKPLFYASVTSKTDPNVAPEGSENLFLLIPVAPGLTDTDEIKDQYFNHLIEKLEKHCGTSISDSIVYKRSYAQSNFIEDYYSFKGNAYGLANTLTQTAVLKPRIKSKSLKNLYFTGQLTVPGPGVPPSLISGEVVANLVEKEHKLKKEAL